MVAGTLKLGRMPIRLGCAGLALLIVAGCSSRSDERQRRSLLQTIGLTQSSPDEFLIVERRPLEMPTDYAALPAPAPGTPNRVDPTPQRDVSTLLKGAGTVTENVATPSSGEAALLAGTNANATDPTIRDTVRTEAAEVESRTSGRYGLATIFGRRTSDPYADVVLDPNEENERLKNEGLQTPAAPPAPEAPKSNEWTLYN